MADDLTIPATGSVVATDDVSSKHYQRVKIAAGADGVAADSGTYSVSANFNRPSDTTAYAIGDNVSNSTTAGSVTPLSFALSGERGIVRRVRIRKSTEGTTVSALRLWLFESSPTVGSGDNAAFTQPLAASVGYVDVSVTNSGSDDAVGWTDCDLPVVAATCYGLLQTTAAFTPTSAETFTITLWYLNG
jgi:hypothetical protein